MFGINKILLLINEREVGKKRKKSRTSRKVVKVDRRIGTRQEHFFKLTLRYC